METNVEVLSSYLPEIILRRFAEDPEPLSEPMKMRFPGAVFFADISGFTKIAEGLAQQGTSGAEQLTELLDDYFGQMISIIASHGGDIVKFAGDALFAMWYNEKNDMVDAIERATICALEVRDVLDDYQAVDNLALLHVRVSIGAGDLLATAVGGNLGRWEFLIAGDPLKQVGIANDFADPGDVVLSNKAWQFIEDRVNGSIRETEDQQELFFVESVTNGVRPKALSQVRPDSSASNGMKGFVSGAIWSRLEIFKGNRWLFEHRRLSIIFLQVTNLDYTEDDAVQQLQTIMYKTQSILYQFEGSVRQLIEDDKGTVFIAAFGLPPFTHNDDPKRAVLAAMSMQKILAKEGFHTRIGVTSGNVFCGPIGNPLRREYTLVGSVVNLAARLMGATKKLNVNILCDQATYDATQNYILYEATPPIRLKNIAEPVTMYRPASEAQFESSLRPLVGRQEESKKLNEYLHQLRDGNSNVVVIEGPEGIGKSRLVTELLDQADAMGIFNIVGTANSIDQYTPYHIWNDILSKLFDTKVNVRTTLRRDSVMAKLMKDKELVKQLPLLNAVLHLDLPEPPQIADMSQSVRQRNIQSYMLRIFETMVDNNPSVMVLDNYHWMDSTSWDFVYRLLQEVEPMLLVLVGRPPIDGKRTELDTLLGDSISERIELDNLSVNEISQLVSFCLEVSQISDELAEFIHKQSDNGNPFFSQEIAYAMREDNNIVEIDGVYRFSKTITSKVTATGEIQLDVPQTLYGILTKRFDRLEPAVELTLKTASVIGIQFDYRILRDIYPIEDLKSDIRQHLDTLLDLSFIATGDDDGKFVFRQNYFHEVAYDLIPFTQRKELHLAVAKWYEKNHIYDLTPYYQLLAHHWEQGEEFQTAVKYLEKAGENSLDNGGFQETIDIFKKCLSHAEEGTSIPSRVRIAHWERMIGEAYWGLGNFEEARIHAEKALIWLSIEIPDDSEMRRATFQEAFLQLRHRVRTNQFLGKADDLLITSEAVHVFRLLEELSYYDNELDKSLYYALKTINLAESVGEKHPELARAYANMYLGLSINGRHRLARIYKRLALTTIEKVRKNGIKAPVMTRIGMYDIAKGQWTTATSFIDQAATLYEKTEDKRGWADTQLLLAFISFFRGDFWESSDYFDALAITAQRLNNSDRRITGLSGYALQLLALDKLRLAMTQLQQARPLWESETNHPVTIFFSKAVFAKATLHSGHLPRAKESADEALALIELSYRSISSSSFLGTTALANVYWMLAEADQYRDEALQALGKIQERLDTFSDSFSAMEPYIDLYDGRFALLQDKTEIAKKLFEQALKSAQTLSMPYIIGQAYFELAKLTDDLTEQADLLALALEQLEDLRAAYYIDLVKQYIATQEG